MHQLKAQAKASRCFCRAKNTLVSREWKLFLNAPRARR